MALTKPMVLNFGLVFAGMARDVRRSVYLPSSIAAQGILWEWEGDVNWFPYDMELSEVLEDAYRRNVPEIGTCD